MNFQTPWLKFTLNLLFLGMIIHIVYGFMLGLSVDEAHYALYGLYPDWSYFDHPPMVGWLQIIPAKGHWPVGLIRLVPELLWLLSVLLSMHLTKVIIASFLSSSHYHSLRSAHWWTALLILTTPILHVLAVGLLPDTLLLVLVPCMMLLTISIHNALDQRYPRDIQLWISLGVILGLAGLSKYTSLFFALGVLICLLQWHGLKIFSRPGLWLCLLIAITLITPVLYWNMNHDWISFKYQLGHGAGGEWKFRRIGNFLLTQLACYGLLNLLGLTWVFRRYLSPPIGLFSFSVIPFLIFAVMSGGGGSLPHWTSPAWIAITPICAIGLANAWFVGRKFWITTMIFLQLSLVAIGFFLLASGGLPGVSMKDPLGQKNPIADLYGWDLAGEKLNQIAIEKNIPHIVTQNWTMGSRLAWYTQSKSVHILDDRRDQFDIWFGKMPEGEDAVLLQWSQMTYELPIQKNQFSSCDKIDSMPVKRSDRAISQFDFYVCKDWGQIHPEKIND